MSSIMKFIFLIALGVLIGVSASQIWQSGDTDMDHKETIEKEPLYWVAPMDANYRRDKPGKSPMGMDLVPVYAEDASSETNTAGLVEIEPHVVNNLGVRTAEVEMQTVTSPINTVGYVQYNENKLVHIHPRVDGWIEKLYVRAEGDPVKAGQPLYELYSPELVNAQEEILIARRLKDKALLESSRERMRALQISDKFIDNLLKTGNVKQAVTFYSPQDGVVDKLEVRDGFYVTPGNNLMSIGQLDNVWVEAEVFERDAARVFEGQHVELTTEGYPGKIWQGKVDYIYPTLRAESRTLRLRISLDNPDLLLRPNMYALLRVHTKSENKLVVPHEAVIRTGQQNRVVLALDEGKFKSVAVSLGRINSNYIEILDGLSEGETVVTSAQFLIDSESSKTSDFKRMSGEEETDSVWMKGTVNSIMLDSRMLNISHEAVPEWQMMGMTMHFMIAPDVDMSVVKAGQEIHFQAQRVEAGFLITMIHIMAMPDTDAMKDSENTESEVDHSDHH